MLQINAPILLDRLLKLMHYFSTIMCNTVVFNMHHWDHNSHQITARRVNVHFLRHHIHVEKLANDEQVFDSELVLPNDV